MRGKTQFDRGMDEAPMRKKNSSQVDVGWKVGYVDEILAKSKLHKVQLEEFGWSTIQEESPTATGTRKCTPLLLRTTQFGEKCFHSLSGERSQANGQNKSGLHNGAVGRAAERAEPGEMFGILTVGSWGCLKVERHPNGARSVLFHPKQPKRNLHAIPCLPGLGVVESLGAIARRVLYWTQP